MYEYNCVSGQHARVANTPMSHVKTMEGFAAAVQHKRETQDDTLYAQKYYINIHTLYAKVFLFGMTLVFALYN